MKPDNLFMAVAFIGAVYFLFISALLQFLRNDLSVIYDPLSLYAIGRYSFFLTAGFFSLGITEILLAFHLRKSGIGAFLLGTAGICVILIGFLPTDIGPAVTIRGHVHIWAALGQFSLFPLAVLFLARPANSRILFIYSICTGVFTLILLVAIMAAFNFQKSFPFGLIQKANILAITAWLIARSWIGLKEKFK